VSVLVGEQVQVGVGVWQNAPTSYAYQWQRCDGAGGNCSDVTGETRSDYVARLADVGYTLRCVVTATNAGGDSSGVATAAVGPVTVSPPAPGGSVSYLNQLLVLESA
jgi:hypothetical protein